MIMKRNITSAYFSKLLIPCLVVLSIVFLFSYALLNLSQTSTSAEPSERNEKHESIGSPMPRETPFHNFNNKHSNNSKMKTFVKEIDFETPAFPSDIENRASGVKINTNRINIMGVDTFYREAVPPPAVDVSQQTVLLLHGAAFKSQTWLELNTIHLLAAMGHHVVAVDLPGFGETPSSFSGQKEDYLKALITALNLKNLVIVSPSMSGGFSIPYLLKNFQDLDGFVPVAPVSTQLLVTEGSKITTPTLIVYGELDKNLGVTSAHHLSRLPNSKAYVLPNARHPAYLQQPKMFHTLLYNFLKQIKIHKT